MQHLLKQAMDMSSMAWLIGMCLTTQQPKMNGFWLHHGAYASS